ncbi:hypothetical protein ABB37_00249 [Leptomonas pyrrhocoris]|uniref:Uncharacterized protein n=1 Tax=Leptomonas pyrrhocoris TaxID=157538 RepID=A0A0N0E021_LEPPY|nr:hypothetical protein ABB37_00249 [Leptomonas pyrrhocoris]KPA85951.1 hypothetical protein ABB37_00249 [Leptomonas pyrrhocoris]|eukprot:XP_015664390.1 hypothetical protein ABB37_00249 [Leptomonas pyrrhocoris]
MANPYADPTSIDYILQRAQDELRRGENQHLRAAEAQYTNHVKELLGNLERYLETCGVQLPAEVITGSEATAAAAAAFDEPNVHREAVRSSLSSQAAVGLLGGPHIYLPLHKRSLSASAAPNNVCGYRDSQSGNGPLAGENPHPRVGWNTLATPTEASQLDHSTDERRAEFATNAAAAALRYVRSEPAGGGLMTSLGSHDIHSPVSPQLRQEMARRLSSANAEDDCRRSENDSVIGNSFNWQHVQQLHTHPQVASLDVVSLREGQGSSMVRGSSPLVATVCSPPPMHAQQQRTPFTAALVNSSNPHPSPQAAVAHARSVSLNAVAASNGAHVGSGTDTWGDFGQFVQSITESRINGNWATLPSATAAAVCSSPATCISDSNNGGPISPAETTATTRTRENTNTTTDKSTSTNAYVIGAASTAAVPETSFQLPHVLVTANSPFATSPNDLQSSLQQQSQAVARRVVHSPLGVDPDAPPSAARRGAGNTRGGFAESPHRQPLATETNSMSIHSPSLTRQAAYGAGSNAVRALAVATTETDVEKENSAQVGPAEHIPSPPPQHRPGSPLLLAPPATMVTAPMQHVASPSITEYLPYGKGGSPYFPHILRVCTSATSSNPRTQLNSPSQPVSRKSSSSRSASPPQEQRYDTARGSADAGVQKPFPIPPPSQRTVDAAAAVRIQEKKQLMRRLRGILDKFSSPSATPSVITSLADTGSHSVSVNGGGGDPWRVKTPPATAPGVVTAPLFNQGQGGVRAIAAGTPPEQNHFFTVGTATYPPAYTRRTPVLYPLNTEQALHGQRSSLFVEESDTAEHHATSLVKANLQPRTPSSQDMGSLPIGLCSDTRPPNSSMQPHNSVNGTASGGVEVGHCTTTYSTAALAYAASTVSLPYASANDATPLSGEYKAPPVKGAGPVDACRYVRSPNQKVPTGLCRDEDHPHGADIDGRRRDNYEECRVFAARDRDGKPRQNAGEVGCEEKLQLMQRLRTMLSRPDE